MQSLNVEEKKQVLGEILHDQLKVIEEYVKDVPKISRKVNSIEHKVDKLTAEMKAVKAVLKNHVSRLVRLEA